MKSVVESGAVPNLVRFLSDDTDIKLQNEVCWSLSNIISNSSSTKSHQTQIIVENGQFSFSVQCEQVFFAWKSGGMRELVRLLDGIDSANEIEQLIQTQCPDFSKTICQAIAKFAGQ